MVKLMWFFKRKDGVSLDEFRRWWVEHHAKLVSERQKPHLRRYVVNVRTGDDELHGRPATPSEWDGCAEQWFDDEAAVKGAYDLPPDPSFRADVMAHVGKVERIVVVENEIKVLGR
jgi:uncharacterized protein (TIGR02118 family)